MYTEKELKSKYRRLRGQLKKVWDELTPNFEDNKEYTEIRESLVRVNEAIRGLKEDSKGDLFYKYGNYTSNYDFPLEWYSKYDVKTAEKIMFFFINRQQDEKEIAELFSNLIGANYELELISKIYEDCKIEKGNGYTSKNNLFYAIKELVLVGLDISNNKQIEVLKKLLTKVYFKHILYGFKKVLNNKIDLSVLEKRLYNNEKYLYSYDKSKGQGYSYLSHHEPYEIDSEDRLYLDTLLEETEDRYDILCSFIDAAKYEAKEKKKYSSFGYYGSSKNINIEEEIEKEYKKFLFDILYEAFKENRIVEFQDLKETYESSELIQNVKECRGKEIREQGLRILKIREESGELDNLSLVVSDISTNVGNSVFTEKEFKKLIKNINKEFDEQSPSRIKAKSEKEKSIKEVDKVIKNAKEQVQILSKEIDFEEAEKKYNNYIQNKLRGVSIILTTDLTKYSPILKYGAKGKIRNIYERKFYIDFEEGKYNSEIYDSGFEIVDIEYLAVKEVVKDNRKCNK